MKRLLTLIFIVTFVSQFLISCSLNNNIQFKELREIIGLSESALPVDSILMMTNENYQKNKDKYFTPRKIITPTESLAKGKAILYLQYPSSSTAAGEYRVKGVSVNGDNLIVNLKKAKIDTNSPYYHPPGTYKWATFIELDKANLKDNMIIQVK